jgi:hypothetical protein
LFIKTLDPYADPDSLEMLDPDPYPGSGFSESGSTALFCTVMLILFYSLPGQRSNLFFKMMLRNG